MFPNNYNINFLLIIVIYLLNFSFNEIFTLEVVDGKKDLVQPNEKHYDGVPQFLRQPLPIYYVNKTNPAVIICEAEPVSHVNIYCAEKDYSYMGEPISESGLKVNKFNNLGFPDPENGKRWLFSLQVKLKDVIEWFSEYKCYCEAWNQIMEINKAKKVHSSVALVQESYFQNKFKKPPQNQAVAEDQRLELICVPPDAKPFAEVFWLINNQKVNQLEYPRIIIDQVKKHLIIDRVRRSDAANYTCGAQSLGVTKFAPSAIVTITSKYFWSEWTEWKRCPDECLDSTKCSKLQCLESQRKKIRFCIYKNSKTDVINCRGTDSLFESCDRFCNRQQIDLDESWKHWSDWSISCSPHCLQTRVRVCYGDPCRGLTSQKRNCSENLCLRQNMKPEIPRERTAMYLGLFITITILFMIIMIILCFVTRKGYLHLLPRRTIAFASQSNGVKKMYNAKMANSNNEKLLLSNSDTNSPGPNHVATPVSVSQTHSGTIKNRNATTAGLANHHLSVSPITATVANTNEKIILDSNNNNKTTVATTHFINSNNNNNTNSDYSPVYEMHQHHGLLINNTRDQVVPAIYSEYPLLINNNVASSMVTNDNSTQSLSPFHQLANGNNINNLITRSPKDSNFISNDGSKDDTPSRPASALYQELSIGRNSCAILSNYLPPDTDLDSVAWATFTGNCGGRLCLPQSGISLTIPRGIFSHGISEELFLAVCRDESRFPVLDVHEILLSPIIMCGPPNVQINKPVIVSLPHCALIHNTGNNSNSIHQHISPNHNLISWRYNSQSPNQWSSIRLLCARYQNHQIPPLWKELAIIHPLNRADSHTYVQMDNGIAHVILDHQLPQMFCLTGRYSSNQSLNPNQSCDYFDDGCSIKLRILAFSQPAQSSSLSTSLPPPTTVSMDQCRIVIIRIHFVLDTREAVQNIVDMEIQNNCVLLDGSKKLIFSSRGGDLALNVGDISYGWRCRSGSKIQNFAFPMIWKLNHVSSVDTLIVLEQLDPNSKEMCVASRISFYQTEQSQNQVILSIVKDTDLSRPISVLPTQMTNNLCLSPNKIALSATTSTLNNTNELSNSTNSNINGLLDENDQIGYLNPLQTIFRLSFTTRQNLWPLLDPLWQTLANHLSLNGNLTYFSDKPSPTDCILDLWEARNRQETALLDLINIMRLIGRNDCAMILEQDLVSNIK